jgi:hypothetical protein
MAPSIFNIPCLERKSLGHSGAPDTQGVSQFLAKLFSSVGRPCVAALTLSEGEIFARPTRP